MSLRGRAQAGVPGAGGDDHRPGDDRIAIDDELERMSGEIDAVEMAELNPRAEPLRLLL